MPIVTLNHLINGVAVPYTRSCSVNWIRDDVASVRIKGAADGHYRNRTVKTTQLSHLESVNNETGLSGGINSDALGDGRKAGSTAPV